MTLTAKEYKELLIEIRDTGSDRAFRRLYDESYERLFRTAYYYMQSDEWAREVALDVLADVWDRRKTMILPDDWERWSYVATKNKALNTLDKEKRRRGVGEPTEADAPQYVTPAEELEAEETHEIYERTVWNLPDRCREAWTLVREEGMTHHEAAEQMGTSEKTVDAHISKALRALREAMLCLMALMG